MAESRGKCGFCSLLSSPATELAPYLAECELWVYTYGVTGAFHAYQSMAHHLVDDLSCLFIENIVLKKHAYTFIYSQAENFPQFLVKKRSMSLSQACPGVMLSSMTALSSSAVQAAMSG